jgi:predicted AAA+ superfamily ATPase
MPPSFNRQALRQLYAWKEDPARKPLIVFGARQVGKTTLVKDFARVTYQKLHYLNFEEKSVLSKIFVDDLEPAELIRRISIEVGGPISPSNDLIFFDEIQECPQALTSLKYFAEKAPEFSIIAAGSLLGVALSEGSFPVGKIDRLNLFPLTFNEYLDAFKQGSLLAEHREECLKKGEVFEPLHQKLLKALGHYLFTGGLPEIVATAVQGNFDYSHNEQIRHKQRSLVRDYLADMAKHSGKVNAMHLERIFSCSALQLSTADDRSTNRFKFQGVVPGVSQYMRLSNAFDWLEKAGLIVKSYGVTSPIHPLRAQVKEGKFKSYLFDVGIMGALAGVDPEAILQQTPLSYKGFLAEQFVLQELRALGHDYFYNWHSNEAEIEFLVEERGGIIPIEVKSGRNTRSRSLQSYTIKYAPRKSFIVSGKSYVGLSGSDSVVRLLPLYMIGEYKNL